MKNVYLTIWLSKKPLKFWRFFFRKSCIDYLKSSRKVANNKNSFRNERGGFDLKDWRQACSFQKPAHCQDNVRWSTRVAILKNLITVADNIYTHDLRFAIQKECDTNKPSWSTNQLARCRSLILTRSYLSEMHLRLELLQRNNVEE